MGRAMQRVDLHDIPRQMWILAVVSTRDWDSQEGGRHRLLRHGITQSAACGVI